MPPSSRIYYKFKSTAKFKTIDLVDHWISVAELKPLIAQKEGLGTDDTTELLLSDPRTGEEFRDATKQVAQNSSIVVRRVPVIRHDALQAKHAGPAATVPGLGLPGLGPLLQGSTSSVLVEDTTNTPTDAFGGAVYGDQPESDGTSTDPINDIMQRMVKQQAESHRLQVMDQRAGRSAALGRGRDRGRAPTGGRGAYVQRDLSEFTCSWCGVKGDHFEKDCPAPDKLVKRIRHAAGVPNGALAPSAEGGLLLPNGQYGAIVPNTAGFQAAVAPLLSLTAATVPQLQPAPQVPAVVSAPTEAPVPAITGVQSKAIPPPAPPSALPHQPSNVSPTTLAGGTVGSTPQFAGDDLLELGSTIFSAAAAASTVGLPSLGAPMSPAEFERFKQQQLTLKLQQKSKANVSRGDSRGRHRSRSRNRYRSRRSRSRSRSRSRRRYSRSTSRSRSRSRERSRDRNRRSSRRSHTHSRSRSPSLRRGHSRSSRSPGRLRGRPHPDGGRQYTPAHLTAHAALPVPAQLLQLEDAPVRQQFFADGGVQPLRQHRLANISRNSSPADPASREHSPPTCNLEQTTAPRQRSPVPRRPGLDQRAPPAHLRLSPLAFNSDRWSHDGEASDAAAAIAQKEQRAAEEAEHRQAALEQADAEGAERARQTERARLEVDAEQQRQANQRRLLEKAEKQQQAEEKRAAKEAIQEAEQLRLVAEHQRLALEQKQAEAAREHGRKPSLRDRLSLRSETSSRHKSKRRRSPSTSRSYSSTDSPSSSCSPSIESRGKRARAAGHSKHGGRLRSRSISPSRETVRAVLPRSRSRHIERLQVLGGDLPSRFTVALEENPAQRTKRSKAGKAKKESKHKHKKDHSSKASKLSKRKHEQKGLRRSLEARLSPARCLPSASPLLLQSPEGVVPLAGPAPTADPATKDLPGQAKVQRIKANRPLFALALGDTKKKKKKSVH